MSELQTEMGGWYVLLWIVLAVALAVSLATFGAMVRSIDTVIPAGVYFQNFRRALGVRASLYLAYALAFGLGLGLSLLLRIGVIPWVILVFGGMEAIRRRHNSTVSTRT